MSEEKSYTNTEALAHCLEHEGAVFMDRDNFRVEMRDGVPHVDGEKAVMAFAPESGPFRLVKRGKIVRDAELPIWEQMLNEGPPYDFMKMLEIDKRTAQGFDAGDGELGGTITALRSVGLKLQIVREGEGS